MRAFVCNEICILLDTTDRVEDITFLYIDLRFSITVFGMSLTVLFYSSPVKKFRQWIYFCGFQNAYEMFFFSKWKQREASLKVLLHEPCLTPTNPCYTRTFDSNAVLHETICNSPCKIRATMSKVFWIAFKNLQHVALKVFLCAVLRDVQFKATLLR